MIMILEKCRNLKKERIDILEELDDLIKEI